jgi:DNA-directed RNA polymerase specialized sigma24 family protein
MAQQMGEELDDLRAARLGTIILLYLEDQNYDEIAAITGLIRTNVSVRLVRIKRALKDYLQRQR